MVTSVGHEAAAGVKQQNCTSWSHQTQLGSTNIREFKHDSGS